MLVAVGRSYNATVLKGRITETRKPDEKGDYTMKKKINKIMAVFAVTTMVLGTGIISYADVPSHTCNYSLVECKDQGIKTAGTHQYIAKVDKGQEIMGTCTVTYHAFLDINRCGCGAQKTSPHGFTIHSSCGQH